MLAHLADVSLRSLLLALVAAAVLWVLRNRRTAAIEHAVWSIVMIAMLGLFAFGEVFPRLPLRVLGGSITPAPEVRSGEIAPPRDTIYAEFPRPLTPATPHRPLDWKIVAMGAYAAVALAFLAHFSAGIFFVRKLFRSGQPVSCGRDGVYESNGIAVPVTAGFVRPKILLPPNWCEWDASKLDLVLTHEAAHIRRRDGLIAALAGLNRCIFWFHPLAWILQRRLALLAEQASDEYCVAERGDREQYARLLLEMASAVDRSMGRLNWHATMMAAGPHIRQRIEALLEKQSFSQGMTRKTWAAVLACGTAVVFCAGAVELERQRPVIRWDAPRLPIPAAPPLPSIGVPAPPTLAKRAARAQLAQAQTQSQANPTVESTPKWDSISIKPCGPADGAGRSGRGGAQGRGIPPSPGGELFVNCLSVSELLNTALWNVPNPLLNDPFDDKQIRGGPAWMYSDYYTIDAKSSDPAVVASDDPYSPAARKLLTGTMLVALLEDRFQLRMHRETEQIPMFSIVVGGSGFKLQPMQEGGCTPHEPGTPLPRDPLPPDRKPLCISRIGWQASHWILDAAGQSMTNLAYMLGMPTGRPVLDKTGITGQYVFHIVFAHDQNAPGKFPKEMPSSFGPGDGTDAPTLPTVLEQQLGLTLVPDTGPHEYVEIDAVARPLIN